MRLSDRNFHLHSTCCIRETNVCVGLYTVCTFPIELQLLFQKKRRNVMYSFINNKCVSDSRV